MVVNGTDLSMIRGDSESISVKLSGDATLSTGDSIDMMVRKKAKSPDVYIKKHVTALTNGEAVINILPEDTKDMPFGEYVYDIQWTASGGVVTTIIEKSVFEIREEVTY